MEQLKAIKRCLVDAVQNQVGDLKKTNAKELGEVIDMIKDLEEAMYYCSIIKAMEKSEEESEKTYNNINYYMEGNPVKMYGGRKMYDNRSSNDRQYMGDISHYTPYMEYAPYMMRDKDWREDKLYNSRRTYVEGKMNHVKDTESMQDLEQYMTDLGDDITDMIRSSSPEEKQVLSQKLQMLASKVNK
jgi:hypothetical protein